MVSVLVLAWLAQSPDPYELTHVALRNELYRTGYVLLQELAYRSKSTERTRSFFVSVRSSVPSRVAEPPYSYGYLWPHWTRTLVKPPVESLEDAARKATGRPHATFEFLPWTVLRAPKECLDALEIEGFTRTLESRQPDYAASSQPTLSRAQILGFLEGAEALGTRRLIAGLLCDLCDRRDLESLKVVSEWPGLRAILPEPIPAGCDTIDLPWQAFREAIRGEGKVVEVTFEDLLDRAIVVSTKERGHDSARMRTFRKLEERIGEGQFENISFRHALTYVCKLARIEDSTDWEALGKLGIPVDAEITYAWSKGEPCRGAIQWLTYRAVGDKLRLSVGKQGGIVFVPTK